MDRCTASTAPNSDPNFRWLGCVSTVGDLNIQPECYMRFNFNVDGHAVPALLWVPASGADHLVIVTNGAVKRDARKSPHEVFQRRKWVREINANVLFIADPTLQPSNNLSIGWGQGSRAFFALPAMARLAQRAGESLNIDSINRLYFGTSAGGFQALQLAVRDRGSQSLVNNPQMDWTLYNQTFAGKVARQVYDIEEPSAVREAYPDRTSIAAAFAKYRWIPKFKYLLNSASSNDVDLQLPALLESDRHFGKRIRCNRVTLEVYHDETLRHNPLPREVLLKELQASLDRLGSE